MTLDIRKYNQNPPVWQAAQITADNTAEVASWSGIDEGELVTGGYVLMNTDGGFRQIDEASLNEYYTAID